MKIRIANPRPGSARYTTVNQAERYVRLGMAVMTAGVLCFTTSAEERQRQAIRYVPSSRCCSDAYVLGVVYWNGEASPFAMRKPGEVRS